MIPWWVNDFGISCAQAAYEEIMRKNISQGIVTRKLEDRISEAFNMPNVIAMNSGSSALYAILKSLGLRKDQEIIIQARTWVATLNSALLANLKVKIVDIDSETLCMNLDHLKKLINVNNVYKIK